MLDHAVGQVGREELALNELLEVLHLPLVCDCGWVFVHHVVEQLHRHIAVNARRTRAD